MPETAWRMYAHDRNGTFWHLGSRSYVEAHGLRDPIVEVEAREVAHDAPDGTHWGWLHNDWRDGWESTPSMIWPNRPCFDVCFTYGPAAEEKAGKGRVVRLAVRALNEREDGVHVPH